MPTKPADVWQLADATRNQPTGRTTMLQKQMINYLATRHVAGIYSTTGIATGLSRKITVVEYLMGQVNHKVT